MLTRVLNPVRQCVSVRRAVTHTQKRGMARILATDEIDATCVDIFKSRGHTVDVSPTRPEAELIKVIGDYDALIVRSATKVTPAVFAAAKKLRVVGRAGVGVDNINIAEATRTGVMVMNTPDGNTISTAQLAMAMLCSAARMIPSANISVKEGKWTKKEFMGRELHGKTLGIIGCGRIGQLVAKCATGMGMEVIGFDAMAAAAAAAGSGSDSVIQYQSSIESIYKLSDFITVHTPLTPETKHLLNDATIAQCKRGVQLINCARGGIIEEAALLRALISGQVGGAALDVYTTEPPSKLSGEEGETMKALLSHPRVVCTPHLGASTEEAQVKVARDIAVQMCDLFDQKDYVGIINVPFMSLSTDVRMKPFMILAESMGALLAQILDTEGKSALKKVVLRTNGGRDINIVTHPARQLLEAMLLKGIIKHSGIDMHPDMISAPAIAAQIGLTSEISSELAVGNTNTPGSRYWNLVTVHAEREDGSTSVIGGAVLENVPHIVQVSTTATTIATTATATTAIATTAIATTLIILLQYYYHYHHHHHHHCR
jgi:D-3-phosphoglycerate dehydrogenase